VSAPQPATKSTGKRRVLRALGGFLVLVVLTSGVLLLQQRAQNAAADTSAASDSTVVARGDSVIGDSTVVASSDSAASDSTQAQGKKKGGLFAFLKRNGDGENEPAEEKKPLGVPVEVASTRLQDVPMYFTGTATVEALQEASVLAKIAGTIEKILVEEGDFVEAGQLLLQIDDAEESARLAELRVRASSLENDFKRTQSLLEKQLTSRREYEDKKLLMEEAQAKFHVGEIRLGYTQVRAPFSGRVTLRHVDVGQYVQVNQELFGLADFDPLLVRVYLPEREADRVSVGQEVRVISDTGHEERYDGRVRMVSPIVDTRTGTVKVTVEINDKTDLRIGAFVRVQITTDVHQNALVVPNVALVEEGGETFVYRADADSVLKVRVQTGYTDEEVTEVLVGLAPDDRVVTVGQGGLQHGARIRDLNATTAATDSTQVQNDERNDEVARR
jgi:RND family efflux transporter MFP subunit